MERNVLMDGGGLLPSICRVLSHLPVDKNTGLVSALKHFVAQEVPALDGRVEIDIVAGGQAEDGDIYTRVRLLDSGLPGGKGGFGAQLRGATASKKTTNFDACRDLQGRRIRDVEDEKRLAQWHASQASKASESRARKTKPNANPMPQQSARDPSFRKAEFQDSLEDAGDRIASVVEVGLSAEKRKLENVLTGAPKNNKSGRWMDPILDLSDADDESFSDDDAVTKGSTIVVENGEEESEDDKTISGGEVVTLRSTAGDQNNNKDCRGAQKSSDS